MKILTNIKNFFNKIWFYIVLGLLTIIGGLLFILQIKNKEIAELKIKVLLIKTEKEADSLKVDVESLLKDNKRTDDEIKDLEQILVDIKRKKEELKDASPSSSEIENYWN